MTLPIQTKPVIESDQIQIGNKRYSIEPADIVTLRPDLFKPGYFSVFDILLHLSNRGEFDLTYHFDESLNTHVIDELKGSRNWWYMVRYSGGWPENNVFRMDHYPWKDGTRLKFAHTTSQELEVIYQSYQEEISRLKENDDQVIIQEVKIRRCTFDRQFSNVKVTAHNMRSDALQDGVITALDTILSLGDEKNLPIR